MKYLMVFIAIAFLSLHSLDSAASTRVALVIGNSEYHHIRALPNTKNDAEDMAVVLSDLGFTLYQGKAHHNLAIDEMIKLVDGFVGFAQGKEIALIYYAGHGLQFENPNLLAVDVPGSNLSLIRRRALDLDGDLLKRLDGKAELLVAIFDACREIPEYEGGNRSVFSRGRGLQPPKSPSLTSRIIAYSGGAGQTVDDGDARKGGNSPYTSVLLRNLSELREGVAGQVVHDVLSIVAADFKEQYSLPQSPEVLLQGFRPDSRFVLGPPVISAPAVSPDPTPHRPLPEPAFVRRVQHWLIKHGYPLSETGVVDTRTQLSIRDFEQKEGLLITGEADRILLQQLEASYWRKDEAAWQQATKNHTREGYETYLAAWADGKFREQAQQQKDKFKLLPGPIQELVARMVPIPAGVFRMGCSDGDTECYDTEKPVRTVRVPAFKLMATEVTFAMWDACVMDGGCQELPSDAGWGRANRPVINVSYNDITQEFIPWLNRTTGQSFRLPSEAEWEYAARASTNTKYSWGNSINCSQARYGRRHGGECSNSRDGTAPVTSFADNANAFGLYDMHGNVWEWTADCWNGNYTGAPVNGSAWQSGDCSLRVLRGGSWDFDPRGLRVSYRLRSSTADRNYILGFRLAQGE